MRPRFELGMLKKLGALMLLAAAAGCAGALSSGGGGNNEGPGLNLPPVILGDTITSSVEAPQTGHSVKLTVEASDPEDQALTFSWDDGGSGQFSGSGNSVFWLTDNPGSHTITCTVTDTASGSDSASISLTVTQAPSGGPNTPPVFDPAGITGDVSDPVAGQEIIFKATATDADGDQLSYIWSDDSGKLNFSDQSVSAEGVAKATWKNSTPGTFTISLVANDGRSSSKVLSESVSLTTSVTQKSFPTSFAFMGKDHCNNCHPDVVAQEEETAHAHREDNMQAAGLGRLEACRECHDVGYKQGGFIDYKTTPQFANVQCESCHGSGVGHPANGPLPTNFDAELSCNKCHTGSHHPTADEWRTSGHATFAIDAANADDNTVEAACIKCHNGEYFVKIQINGQDPPAEDLPAGSGAHIGCATCHDPHNAAHPNQLRVNPDAIITIPFDDTPINGGPANTCLMCHNGRRSRADMEKTIAQGGRGFHGNSQGPMLLGVGGFEFPGVVYDREHPHNIWNKEKCVTCHMYTKEYESEEAPAITGHSFKPSFEACLSCHTFDTAAEMEAYVDAYQADIETELVAFETAWPAEWKTTNDEGELTLNNAPDSRNDPPQYQGPPLDDPIGEQYRQAWWDYYYVKADASHGVHNPSYARSLIESALDKLNELNAQ